MRVLSVYDWPGNVRELRNAFHRAYVLRDPLSIQAEATEAILDGSGAADHPPVSAGSHGGPAISVRVGETLENVEEKFLTAPLAAVKSDKRATAELLGVNLKTIYSKLKQYGIER